MAEKAVIGIWGVWLLVSLLVYIPRLTVRLRSWDVFMIVPEWRFFAPVPAQGVYHVLYRDELRDGSVTDWTEIQVAEKRRWWNCLWNPGRRGRKAFFDAVVELVQHVKYSPEMPLESSTPYLTLLNYVTGRMRPAPPAFTQFLIMHSRESYSEHEPEPVVLSGLHSL